MKSIAAVVVSFVLVAALFVLTDAALHALGIMPLGAVFDAKLLAVALFYRVVYTIIGGYVAAKMAPSKPLWHALALGIIGMCVTISGAMINAVLGPAWYAWGLVILALPSVWLGAYLYTPALATKQAPSAVRPPLF